MIYQNVSFERSSGLSNEDVGLIDPNLLYISSSDYSKSTTRKRSRQEDSGSDEIEGDFVIPKKSKTCHSISFSSNASSSSQVLDRLKIENLTRETNKFISKNLGEHDIEAVIALGLLGMAGGK
jgi:hypothetical protein